MWEARGWRESDADVKSFPSIARWADPELLGLASLKCEETSLLRRPLEDDEWRAVFKSIQEVILLGGVHGFNRIGEHVAGLIQAIDPVMTRYCRLTCPACADPCCNGRKVFFNRTDLITLAAIGETGVPGQTRCAEGQPCRYLGGDGCRLSRRTRPYVCVWFLCEPQMELLRGEPARFQRTFTETLQEIRHARLMLETLFEHTTRT